MAAVHSTPSNLGKLEKLRQEIRKLRIRNDRDERLLVARDLVTGAIARCLAGFDRILEQKLVNEYPAAVAGMDVPQARIYGMRLGDQIRAEVKQLAKEWPE